MTVRFEPLLTVGVSHDYYGGPCEAADYIVPRDTAAVMRGGRVLARRIGGSLGVYFEADESGKPLLSLAGRTLRFGLKPLAASFATITNLPAGPAAGVTLYGNTKDAALLDPPRIVVLTGGVLRHELSRSERPVTVAIRTGDGAALRSETVTAEDGRSSVSFDLAGAAAGRLTIEERYPDDVKATGECYLDDALRAEGVIAVLDLRIEAAFYETPPAFVVGYEARAEVLKYYVVTRNYKDKDFDDLAVSDEGFEEEGRARVAFTRVDSGGFGADETPVAALGGDGLKVVLFKSQEPVRRRQGGRKHIRLKRGDEVLFDNLPQPQPERVNADLIVHLSRT